MILPKFSMALTLSLLAALPASAQAPQDDTQMLAMAVDRCMATYASRLADSGGSDQDIYAQATQGCAALNDRMTASINARYPPAQASEVLEAMNGDAEANFMHMLADTRSNRAPDDGGK